MAFDLRGMTVGQQQKRVLFLDNLDSFSYNIVHALSIEGTVVDVLRIDELGDMDAWQWQLKLQNYDGYVVGPGPGQPHSHPMLMTTLGWSLGKLPILGVCLGLQAIGQLYGWPLVHGKVPMHGKPSFIQHSNEGIFHDLPNPMQVGRYHSLVVVSPSNLSSTSLKIEATCDGVVMAVSDESNRVWAVQFHPESILTPDGQKLFNAWLKRL